MLRLIPSRRFSVRLGGATSIDVTKPGIDKAYGIRKLRDILDIVIADMIYVADALVPVGMTRRRARPEPSAFKSPTRTKPNASSRPSTRAWPHEGPAPGPKLHDRRRRSVLVSDRVVLVAPYTVKLGNVEAVRRAAMGQLVRANEPGCTTYQVNRAKGRSQHALALRRVRRPSCGRHPFGDAALQRDRPRDYRAAARTPRARVLYTGVP